MFLKKIPPILVIGEYKYYSYCPVCGCVANYRISYNYICSNGSDRYRVFCWVCLDCGAEHCFGKYKNIIKDCVGVSYVAVQY